MSVDERGVPMTHGQDRPTREGTAEQRAEARRAEAHNMELMQTLDDAWNAQDMDTFSARHKNDVVVRWPGKAPTHGVADHRQESLEFFKTFPDQKVHNRPYKTLFASGDWKAMLARSVSVRRRLFIRLSHARLRINRDFVKTKSFPDYFVGHPQAVGSATCGRLRQKVPSRFPSVGQIHKSSR